MTAFLANTTNLPNVAIAVSGGGYRAMIHGASIFNALDGRNETAVKQGTGGVVQLATYMAGLSGGSWFVGCEWNLESSVICKSDRAIHLQLWPSTISQLWNSFIPCGI